MGLCCGHAIVKCLESEGVDLIFGQPGSHNLAIYDALRETPSIRHITVKHEGNAAVMADVYGRLTGKPGVCLTTAGPGATHCVSGIAQAHAARSPVVHISGHCETTSLLPFHGLYEPDFLINVFKPVTKESLSVQKGAVIGETIARAFAVAKRGKKGPVHIEIPKDILEAETELDLRRPGDAGLPFPSIETGLVSEAMKMLRKAKAPIILAGQGVAREAASEEMIHLAERLSAPVMTPWNGRSAIPFEHPLSFGFPVSGGLGTFIPSVSRGIMNESDAVLVVGSDPGEALLDFLKRHPAVVYLDQGEDITALHEVDPALILNGDLKAGLRLLCSGLEGFEPHGLAKERAKKIWNVKHQVREAIEEFISKISDPRHVGVVLAELEKSIPRNAIIASDTGIIDSWMFALFRSHGPDHLLTAGRYGSMGFALPAAMASKLVFPERPVVALCGDGSFLMASSDFGTAVEQRLNIVFVVLNDGHFGTIRRIQEMAYQGRHHCTEIGSPDFAQFAACYGAKGLHVEGVGQLNEAFQRASSLDGPVIIDVRADGQVPFFQWRE